jgi:hypothetical protein
LPNNIPANEPAFLGKFRIPLTGLLQACYTLAEDAFTVSSTSAAGAAAAMLVKTLDQDADLASIPRFIQKHQVRHTSKPPVLPCKSLLQLPVLP